MSRTESGGPSQSLTLGDLPFLVSHSWSFHQPSTTFMGVSGIFFKGCFELHLKAASLKALACKFHWTQWYFKVGPSHFAHKCVSIYSVWSVVWMVFGGFLTKIHLCNLFQGCSIQHMELSPTNCFCLWKDSRLYLPQFPDNVSPRFYWTLPTLQPETECCIYHFAASLIMRVQRS